MLFCRFDTFLLLLQSQYIEKAIYDLAIIVSILKEISNKSIELKSKSVGDVIFEFCEIRISDRFRKNIGSSMSVSGIEHWLIFISLHHYTFHMANAKWRRSCTWLVG